MSQHFPKPYEPFGGDMNLLVEILMLKLIYLIMQQKLI